MSNATNATMPSSNNGSITPAPVTEATLLVLGPVFIGLLLSYMLFGISVMQLYLYYLNFPRDSKFIKALVYVVFLLDILQSITIAALGWDIFCQSWGAPTVLLPVNWTNGVLPTVSGITAAMVQSFYAWRIYMMSKWRVVPIAIVTVALAQMCATLAIAAKIPTTPDIIALHNIYVQAIVWLAGAGCADIMIALSMLYLLYKVGRSNFRGTQRIINHLIRLTIETGFATATCALAELICFLVYQENNLHLLFALMLCKMYSNSLMTSLNSRTTWNSERNTQNSGYTSSSQWTNSMNLSVAPISTGKHTSSRTTNRSGHTGILSSKGSITGGLMSRGHGGGRGTPGPNPTVVHISTATTRDADFNSVVDEEPLADTKQELESGIIEPRGSISDNEEMEMTDFSHRHNVKPPVPAYPQRGHDPRDGGYQ